MEEAKGGVSGWGTKLEFNCKLTCNQIFIFHFFLNYACYNCECESFTNTILTTNLMIERIGRRQKEV